MPGNYIYASAKIRTLEPAILDKTDIERMVDASDFLTAFKVLNDTDYADNLLEVEPENYRLALDRDFSQLYDLLKSIIPDSNLFKLIFLEHDLINLKLLFKAKYFSQEVDNLLRENTVYLPSRLKEFIFNQKDAGLDDEIKNLINEAKKEIGEDNRPDFIDSILTKKYFALKLSLAEKIKNKFIFNLIKTEINNANLIIWLRAKRLNLNKEKLTERLIESGNIYLSKLIKLYSEDLKSLRPLFGIYYDQKVVDSFDAFCEKNHLFELEKALQDFKIRFCQKVKMIASGPEVILAYYLAKETALTNIRLVLTGKFNKIPTEEIKNTLRQVY